MYPKKEKGGFNPMGMAVGAVLFGAGAGVVDSVNTSFQASGASPAAKALVGVTPTLYATGYVKDLAGQFDREVAPRQSRRGRKESASRGRGGRGRSGRGAGSYNPYSL